MSGKSTLRNAKEYKSLLDIWDRKRFKLTILVLECTGLTGDGLNPFVKLVVGKNSLVTKTIKGSSEPVFAELFFHTVNDITLCPSVSFEVLSARIGKDRSLGFAAVDLSKLASEAVNDFWLTLAPAPTGSSRRLSISRTSSLRGSAAAASSDVTGRLHVRLLLSALPGSRPRTGPWRQSYEYSYDGCTLKTGDVVAYSGVGMLSSLTKLLSNSDYSQLGVVLVLPNLYTERMELYVAEVTPNHDGMIDPFAERPKKAVCIFRLFERLHQFHGGNIMLYPLKTELRSDAASKMVSWIWHVHSKGGLPLDLAGGQVQFIKKDLGMRLDRPEIQVELSELSSCLFTFRCLSLAEQIPSDTPTLMSNMPVHLLQLPCFGAPKPLRTWRASSVPPSSSEDGSTTPKSQSGSPRQDQATQSPQQPLKVSDGSPRASPTLRAATVKKAASQAALRDDEPLTSKRPIMPLQRQMSVLEYNQFETGGTKASNPEEADVLTVVDVNSLISDLQAVPLDRGSTDSLRRPHVTIDEEDDNNNNNNNNEDDDEEEEEEENDDVSSPQDAVAAVSPPAFDLPEVPPERLTLGFGTLNLGSLKLDALGEYPNADIILNTINYMPGMELVRLSNGALSVEDATALIRYKHENLGGVFWSFSDLQLASLSLGLSLDAFDSFAKPPFEESIMTLLSPQIASSCYCEPIFDSMNIVEKLCTLFKQAKTFIHFTIPELTNSSVVEALTRAAARGVEVRILVGTERAPTIPKAQVTSFFSNTYLSMWTPAFRHKMVTSDVPEEFIQLQDLSRSTLQGHSFPVRMRRSLVCVDGIHSVVGSYLNLSPSMHDGAMFIAGEGAAKLVHRAFASLWMCVGGLPFDVNDVRFRPSRVLPKDEDLYADDVALFLAFPGNPCNVLQKHVLESLAFSQGPCHLLSAHFTDPAIHGQVQVLPAERLADVVVVSHADPASLSGRLLRSHGAPSVNRGLSLHAYSSGHCKQHCNMLVGPDAAFLGSYACTHRPDLDAAVLVRSPRVQEAMAAQFQHDLSLSTQLTKDQMAPLPPDKLGVSVSDFFE